jgi:hypothetical protein
VPGRFERVVRQSSKARARAPTQAHRPPASGAAAQQAQAARPPRRRRDAPDTRDGRAARLAYFEARKLNNPPNSLLDYNDVKRGLERPAERRAREQRDNPLPDRPIDPQPSNMSPFRQNATATHSVALPSEGRQSRSPAEVNIPWLSRSAGARPLLPASGAYSRLFQTGWQENGDGGRETQLRWLT